MKLQFGQSKSKVKIHQSYRNSTLTAKALPNPGRSQSNVTFGTASEYSFSLATCHPKSANISTEKNAHVPFASAGRLNHVVSYNQPHSTLAIDAAIPERSEERRVGKKCRYRR